MKIPSALKIALLAVAATVFYTYVGQLVPQKEVLPPEVIELDANMTPEELAETGKEIFEGKGICSTCHSIGKSGLLRFPDLAGIGSRAATRIPGISGLRYLTDSLYDPDGFIVDGFNPGMPVINKPPIGLTDPEILAVVAYLQTLGGTLTVTIDTVLPVAGSEAAQTEAAPDEAEASQDLLERFECASCHYLDRPGQLKASSLYDIGSRMDKNAILASMLSDHQNEGFLTQATVEDLRQVVDLLAAKGGN